MAKGDSASERMQEDQQLMQRLGIYPVYKDEAFPVHLSHTFEQVKESRRFEYLTYTTDASWESPHHLVWRKETKCRAKRIADTAAKLKEETVNEMEWRLRIEELVLFRFRVESECPDCSSETRPRRRWRSDVEAIIRGPSLIAKNLEDRRRNREPCICGPEAREMSLDGVKLNTIFSSRADEMILYVSSKTEQEKFPERSKLRKRRPDRILGFQHTDQFDHRLDEIAYKLQDEAGIKTIREMVETTVAKHKNKLLLFPFLVIEAKAEDGEGPHACDIQTAFPIWKMLKIQEELQDKTGKSLNYGGPLLWYISYQGTNWEVSGCYTAERNGKPSYHIRNLWHGHVNEDDGALQILLIIDFIFDWARDVYRPAIISQLRTLSGHQEDTLSALADNDICSLAGDERTNQIEKWRGSIQYPVQTNTEDDRNIEAWGSLDSKLGPGLGVFRPAWIIESVFQCLYVTKHNVKDLLNSIPKGRTPNSLATKAESSLFQNHVLISEDVLSTMEEIWTHKARRQETHGISEEEKLFATIIYHTEISSTWEPRRCISCAVFDREALDELRSFTKRKGRRAALLNAKEFSRENAVNLLHGLQRLNIEASLAAAIACRRQHLREIAVTPSSKQCPTFEFVDTHSVDTCQPVVLAECELISPIYEWRKIASSPKEPADSYLRFSRHSNSLEDTLAVPTVSSYFLDSAPSKNEKYILVHQNRGDRRWISNCLCLYQIKPTEGPPSKKELAKALWRACKDDIVHSLGGYNNWKALQKLKPATPGEPQKAWNIAGKWLEELQPLLPETDNIEASGPAIRPVDTLVGGDRHSSNPANPKTSTSSFQALPAICTSSDAVNQTNIALPDSAVSEIPSSGLEEDDDAELTATLHKSVLTYFAEKGAENPHNASEEPMVQKIQGNDSFDVGQLALAIAGKTQPEHNPHTEPKHFLSAANTNAQAKVDKQGQASSTLPSPSSSPSWRSGAPSPVDSEVTTPPMSVAVPYTSPYLLNASTGSSKRPLELEEDENPAPVHEKKARCH